MVLEKNLKTEKFLSQGCAQANRMGVMGGYPEFAPKPVRKDRFAGRVGGQRIFL